MSIQFWSIGLKKHTKMIENHVHIRYTDHFKQVGVREKNDSHCVTVSELFEKVKVPFGTALTFIRPPCSDLIHHIYATWSKHIKLIEML